LSVIARAVDGRIAVQHIGSCESTATSENVKRAVLVQGSRKQIERDGAQIPAQSAGKKLLSPHFSFASNLTSDAK